MEQYKQLLYRIIDEGKFKPDRTGTGTFSVFSHHMTFDLSKGFPLVTLKKTNFKSIATELLWYLRGDTNISFLKENGVNIWDEWATEHGELGPLYGCQWRNWETRAFEGIDQIKELMFNLKHRPYSRRHLVSAWNAEDLPVESESPQWNVEHGFMALAPCHFAFQFLVEDIDIFERVALADKLHSNPSGDIKWSDTLRGDETQKEVEDLLNNLGVPDKQLNCQLFQRSGDIFLGIPFNIACYSLLTHMIAQQLNMKPGIFAHTITDAHLYANHMEQAIKVLKRDCRELPMLKFARKPKDIFSYKLEDFVIENYNPHTFVKAEVAV